MILYLLLALWAHADIRCDALLNHPPSVSESSNDGARTTRIAFEDEQGSVASMEYRIHHHTRWIMVLEWIGTDSSARGVGISTRLVTEAMLREPQVTEVTAALMYTNMDVFKASFDGSDCRAALRRTPFYKTLARFGFKRIPECDVSLNAVFVTVGR